MTAKPTPATDDSSHPVTLATWLSGMLGAFIDKVGPSILVVLVWPAIFVGEHNKYMRSLSSGPCKYLMVDAHNLDNPVTRLQHPKCIFSAIIFTDSYFFWHCNIMTNLIEQPIGFPSWRPTRCTHTSLPWGGNWLPMHISVFQEVEAKCKRLPTNFDNGHSMELTEILPNATGRGPFKMAA